ncbi:cadherin-related family member 5 isoform X2 [Erpetoichthys calabaricus]|uniref:cadherin-related family member 5 isoform X2 n=1 Tax=Erpetoichthys calabaricus TaxID=27687 RepID=UPI00223494CC|nr:cadherin-related family member 5 isoform X2 [Erpetoichthys calabaricus]
MDLHERSTLVSLRSGDNCRAADAPHNKEQLGVPVGGCRALEVSTHLPLVSFLSIQAQLNIMVFILNINDNEPTFSQSEYSLKVNELTPVGTTVGRIEATDADKDVLIYSLDRNTNGSEFFRLASSNSPSILVAKLLDFDEGEQLELIMSANDSKHMASTTVHITVVDIDNRPPWFMPCDIRPGANNAKICLSAGYTGTVNLTEKEDGPLHFLPGPVYAVDGDKGIGAPINYELVGGDKDGTFQIDMASGNITMTKAVGSADQIVLSVMAYQTDDANKFALTTVTIDVLKKSLNPPVFEKSAYDGFVPSDSPDGSMVLERGFVSRPLKVVATDADFSNGINPDLVYKIEDSSEFVVTAQGFVLTSGKLSAGSANVTVVAEDRQSGEFARAKISVDVTGATTAMSTTDAASMPTSAITTSPINNSTATPAKTTGDTSAVPTPSWSSSPAPSVPTTSPNAGATNATSTSDGVTMSTSATVNTTSGTTASLLTAGNTSAVPTPSPSPAHTSAVLTTNPNADSTTTIISSTLQSSTSPLMSTASPAFPVPSSSPSPSLAPPVGTEGVPIPPPGFTSGDMAALGATLSVILVLCLAIIGFLIFKVHQGRGDYEKMARARTFIHSIDRTPGGSATSTDQIQFVNDGYQDDGDKDAGQTKATADETDNGVHHMADRLANGVVASALAASAAATAADATDVNSLANSEGSIGEKEVKSILTKERKPEDGYKSVWFKEDIEPDAKVDVVIINDDAEVDEEEEEEEEEEDRGSDEDVTGGPDMMPPRGPSVSYEPQTPNADFEQDIL